MIRLAHFTDPHVGPLPRAALKALLNKRITGWFNWHRGRQGVHDMELLARLVADMHAHDPDHIACTGDIVNIGLPGEWVSARIFLEQVGTPDRVSFVPGNHDAYVRGSLEGLLGEIGAYAASDGAAEPAFPFVRRRGQLALVGLSSGVPTAPLVASGTVGRAQMAAAERVLADLARDGLFRVVLIHHPPHVGGASAGRNLTDAPAFEAMIRRVGAELVLHGHNHIGSSTSIMGPNGLVPVVGAPSASSRGGTITHRAGYFLFAIEPQGTGFTITGVQRGLKPDGSLGDLGALTIRR